MAGMLKGIIIGNLGGNPELKYGQDGLARCHFSVACNEKVKGEDRTEWIRVTVFGKLAEICSQYLFKGKQVYLEGRLQTNTWEDQQGQSRFSLEMVANNMVMLGTKADNGQGGGYQGRQGGYQQNSYNQPQQGGSGYQPTPPIPQGHQQLPEQPPVDNDDIPF